MQTRSTRLFDTKQTLQGLATKSKLIVTQPGFNVLKKIYKNTLQGVCIGIGTQGGFRQF